MRAVRGAGAAGSFPWIIVLVLGRAGLGASAEVVKGELTKRLILTGEVVPAESLTITVPRIRSQFLLTITYLEPEGTRVEPGDVLVRFDTSDLLVRRLDLERQLEESRLRLAQLTAEQGAALQDLELQPAEAETEERLSRVSGWVSDCPSWWRSIRVGPPGLSPTLSCWVSVCPWWD